MAKIFGTDGVRGEANAYPISTDFALALGHALSQVFVADGPRRVLVGWDTRRSGSMLQHALASSLASHGIDVDLLPPLPTPALAQLVRSTAACGAIMLTASHNPACDNGFKIFGNDGFKLSDEMQDRVEQLLEVGEVGELVGNNQLGTISSTATDLHLYSDYVEALAEGSFDGIKAVVDCANGATAALGPQILRNLNLEVIECGTEPDGTNINLNCGAMYPEAMSSKVVRTKADIGIAFDGDGDRVIFCSSDGRPVSGDKILGLCAADLNDRGRLPKHTAVLTIMSNLGVHKALNERGIETCTTPVGDRSVLEAMERGGYSFGGEESGHIIFREFSCTGDGIVSAIQVLQIMKRTGKALHELCDFIRLYPSKLTNLQIGQKRPLEELTEFQADLAAFNAALGQDGRCIVRYSGTENKLRILVEASTEEAVGYWTQRLADAAQKELQS